MNDLAGSLTLGQSAPVTGDRTATSYLEGMCQGWCPCLSLPTACGEVCRGTEGHSRTAPGSFHGVCGESLQNQGSLWLSPRGLPSADRGACWPQVGLAGRSWQVVGSPERQQVVTSELRVLAHVAPEAVEQIKARKTMHRPRLEAAAWLPSADMVQPAPSLWFWGAFGLWGMAHMLAKLQVASWLKLRGQRSRFAHEFCRKVVSAKSCFECKLG